MLPNRTYSALQLPTRKILLIYSFTLLIQQTKTDEKSSKTTRTRDALKDKIYRSANYGSCRDHGGVAWEGNYANKNKKAQVSLTNPRDAKACQKLLQFDVLTTLSLIILVYLHSFSCCCVRNLRNPANENSNFVFNAIQGLRSWCQSKAHNYVLSY